MGLRAVNLCVGLRTAVAALALAGCANTGPSNAPALRVTPSEFAGVRNLCVMPLHSEVDDPPRVARFAKQLEDSLRRRGYEVTGPTETTAALDRILREEGGTYDIYTGESEARSRSVASRVRERLGKELSCQATLSPRIVYVVVFWMAEHMFSDGTASWDGARVDLDAGSNSLGTIGGLSLHVRIDDLDDRELFFGAGAIRTTSILDEGFFSIEFQSVEPGDLLGDDELNRMAIARVLAQLPAKER